MLQSDWLRIGCAIEHYQPLVSTGWKSSKRMLMFSRYSEALEEHFEIVLDNLSPEKTKRRIFIVIRP